MQNALSTHAHLAHGGEHRSADQVVLTAALEHFVTLGELLQVVKLLDDHAIRELIPHGILAMVLFPRNPQKQTKRVCTNSTYTQIVYTR